jgi:CubicO group peptidase (beta-lactamase class C family)
MTPLGHVAPGFEPVARAFADNFELHGEVGAAVCAFVAGRPVVDLWGGLADRDRGSAWDERTMALIFSATKAATAICVHLLAERGALELDAPVARYWPELGQAGKEVITLHHVLSHRAGLPVVEKDLDREQVLAWEPVVAAIAEQAPVWPPGAEHGYHARTYGWILGEVVRRVSGLTMGGFFAREVAAPLGLDFYIGLPEVLEPRVATLYAPLPPSDPAEAALLQQFIGPGTPLHRALSGPGDLAYGDVWNTRALHAAEIPSSNGIATARALATMYAALIGAVGGVRLLQPHTIEAARRVHSDGPDRTILLPTRFGLGFMLPPALGLDCPEGCFGHPGAGGALGFADPERGVAFAYVMNQMKMGVTGDERTRGLVQAVYTSLR